MGTVDFGPWGPEVEERSSVEHWARLLPDGWKVRCGLGAASTAIFFVLVEDAAGTERARASFTYEDFGGVASFLVRVVQRWGGS